MEHAGLMSDTRRRIIREVLLGGPNEAEALERVREQRRQVEELMRAAPLPVSTLPPFSPVPDNITLPSPWVHRWPGDTRGKPVY